MTVETDYVEMGGKMEDVKLVARTVIRLDGDSTSVLPTKPGLDGALAVDMALYEMRQQNVQVAINYRAAILERLPGILRGQ